MATAGVKRARKAYDVTFKLKAVDFAEKESKEAAARQFGVDPKTIREWCQKKEQLVALKTSGKSKKKQLVGAGRKALDSDHTLLYTVVIIVVSKINRTRPRLQPGLV